MKRFLSFLFAFQLTTLSAAETHPYQISEDLDKTIQAGLHELYNFDFDKCLRTFASVKDQENDHPMIAFGVASAHWWRVSTQVLETDEQASKELLAAVNHCIKVSEEKIKRGDPTGEGHLTLGGALGLLGRWQAANREWSGAYFKGKRAYRHLVQALEINPRLLDANMGKGIFDYFVATLPSLVRVLAFLGMGGDPLVGLKELQEAVDYGTYSRTPSALFLADIYTNDRGEPEKGLPIIQKLRTEFPKSFFIHIVHIIQLYNSGDLEGLRREADEFQLKAGDGTYPPESRATGDFAVGISYFKNRRWAEAEPHFKKAAESTDMKSPWRVWGRLYYGYVCDAQNRREEATAAYKLVLKEHRRWTSHENARSRLKKPFKGTDEDLKKLNL